MAAWGEGNVHWPQRAPSKHVLTLARVSFPVSSPYITSRVGRASDGSGFPRPPSLKLPKLGKWGRNLVLKRIHTVKQTMEGFGLAIQLQVRAAGVALAGNLFPP